MYSISYYDHDNKLAYVESKTFVSADNASVRALMHLSYHSDTLKGAAIIYQGKRSSKRVRTLLLYNHFPDFH